MKIQDVMARNPSSVTPQTTAQEAARLMMDENIGIVPVVEGHRLVGVVTDRDLALRVVATGHDGQTLVREVMSSDRLATCGPDDDIRRAMDTMASEQVRRIPIVDERGSLVGILAQADVVIRVKDDRQAEETVERISAPGGPHSS